MRRKVLIAIVAVIIAICAAIIVLQQTGIIGSSGDATESISETVKTDDDILPEDTTLANEEISDKNASAETTDSGGKDSETEETTENSTEDDTDKQSTTEKSTTKKDATSKTEATTQKSSNKTTGKSSTTEKNKPTAADTKKSTTKKATTSKSTTTNKSSSKKSATTTTAKQSFSVSIAISCKNALQYKPELPSSGYILAETKYTVKSGTTVMDLLKTACDKNGIELKCGTSYVTNIGGLKEKECTGASGWMYRVNGETVMKSASKCELSAGDSVEWYYVTNSTDN